MPAAAGRPCRPTTTTAATGRGGHHGASGGNALAESLQISVQSTHGVSSTPSHIRSKVHRINWISYCDPDFCRLFGAGLVTWPSLAYHNAGRSGGDSHGGTKSEGGDRPGGPRLPRSGPVPGEGGPPDRGGRPEGGPARGVRRELASRLSRLARPLPRSGLLGSPPGQAGLRPAG